MTAYRVESVPDPTLKLTMGVGIPLPHLLVLINMIVQHLLSRHPDNTGSGSEENRASALEQLEAWQTSLSPEGNKK